MKNEDRIKIGNYIKNLKNIYLKKIKENKIDELKLLLHSKEIFDGNYLEIICHIKRYETDKTLWHVKNRSKLYLFQIEFLRLLHNYLASSLSLKDHSFRFVKKISSTFSNECTLKWDKMNKDNTFNFIQKLRNFIQHRRLPLSSASVKMDITSKGEERTLNLDVEDLLNWNKWRSTKNYIRDFGESMNIKIPLEIHYDKFTKYIILDSEYNKELKKAGNY